LVVVVGSGQNPSLSARTLQLLNWQNDDLICEMSFLTAIVSVRLDSSRLVVILAGETQIFELKTASHLRTLDIANPLGICSITTNHEGGLFAHPSNTSSSVRVFDVSTLSVVIDIPAHKTDIASISLSGDGSRIATASQKGTVVRVFQLPQGKQIATFRRGSRPATISSLSFTSPPNLLCCSSSSDTVHIFSLLHEGARQLFPDPWGSARGASALAVPVCGTGSMHTTLGILVPCKGPRIHPRYVEHLVDQGPEAGLRSRRERRYMDSRGPYCPARLQRCWSQHVVTFFSSWSAGRNQSRIHAPSNQPERESRLLPTTAASSASVRPRLVPGIPMVLPAS
jgi:hypothetical protein